MRKLKYFISIWQTQKLIAVYSKVTKLDSHLVPLQLRSISSRQLMYRINNYTYNKTTLIMKKQPRNLVFNMARRFFSIVLAMNEIAIVFIKVTAAIAMTVQTQICCTLQDCFMNKTRFFAIVESYSDGSNCKQ